MDGWTTSWLLWIALFFAIEIPAVLNKKDGDTLSEHVWQWFAIKGVNPQHARGRKFALLSLLAWMAAHFLTGGKF